ncbi:NUDIX hydrolase [Desertibaculum subflavum]|uniref:NUDIX hydrolase n=1 Tax=Desertibaculum subflavum TaxID=2268458 RepID=UPI000E66E56B
MKESSVHTPTHAGTVVFRKAEHGLEFLLVRPKRGGAEWVLPKGHIEAGEGPEQAALRETAEETGFAVALVTALGRACFSVGGTQVRADFFLARATGAATGEDDRAKTWLPVEAAIATASHPESRDLLQRAAAWLNAGSRTG